MRNLQEHITRPSLLEEEQKVILMISLMILLLGNFTFRYLAYNYFADGVLDIGNPGFWLLIGNAFFISLLVLLNKQYAYWTWAKLGLKKPEKWWNPFIVAAGLIVIVLLLFEFMKPLLSMIGNEPDISHLLVIQDNLPVFILSIIMVWTTSVFLVEIVFRAFLINSLDILLGRNDFSPWIAVVISSLIFGLMHAWQGWGGIVLTGIIGLLFGITYILNGRRIWAIILAHGILNTITLTGIYMGS